jgi:hypothetical protein
VEVVVRPFSAAFSSDTVPAEGAVQLRFSLGDLALDEIDERRTHNQKEFGIFKNHILGFENRMPYPILVRRIAIKTTKCVPKRRMKINVIFQLLYQLA